MSVSNYPVSGLTSGSTLALLLSLSHAAAHAQVEPTDGDELEEIVVFADSARAATKTSTKLVEIPQSISVVTAELFAERGAVNFQDIFRYSAGVSTEKEGVDTRTDAFSARGFDTVQYIDGLNRMPDFVYGARMEVFTLERAEILRGPSAVLYGAGGAGGLFNGVSKRPRPEFGGEVGFQVGNYNRTQVMADITGGLSDTVSGRLVSVYRQAELQPEDQADDRTVIMPSVSWTPGPDTEITALVLYQKDEMGTQTLLPGSNTIYAPSRSAELPIDFFAGDKDFNRMNTEHVSTTLIVDHAINDWVSYSGRARYYEQDVDYGEVWGVSTFEDPLQGTQLARDFFMLDETYEVLNADNNLRIEFSTGDFEHKVLVGVDYTLFEQDRREGFSCGGFTSVTCSGLVPAPLDLSEPDHRAGIQAEFTNAFTTRSTQIGYYLQDQIKYRDRVSLVLGIRRDKSTSEVSGVKEEPNEATSVRVGVIVDVGAGLSPYAGYSESYLPVFGGDFFGNPFKPKEGEQYEVGVKWQPNNTTLVTFAWFDVEETNRLTSDPDNLQNMLQSGKVGAKGYEIEATSTLFKSLNLTAAYSYTDAEVLSDNSGQQGLAVDNLPETLASVWAMNDFISRGDVGLRAGLGVRYVDAKTDFFNVLETPSVTLVDASVDAHYKDWRLMLSVTNLLDKEHYAFCGDLGNRQGWCYPAMDRRIVATVNRTF